MTASWSTMSWSTQVSVQSVGCASWGMGSWGLSSTTQSTGCASMPCCSMAVGEAQYPSVEVADQTLVASYPGGVEDSVGGVAEKEKVAGKRESGRTRQRRAKANATAMQPSTCTPRGSTSSSASSPATCDDASLHRNCAQECEHRDRSNTQTGETHDMSESWIGLRERFDTPECWLGDEIALNMSWPIASSFKSSAKQLAISTRAPCPLASVEEAQSPQKSWIGNESLVCSSSALGCCDIHLDQRKQPAHKRESARTRQRRAKANAQKDKLSFGSSVSIA